MNSALVDNLRFMDQVSGLFLFLFFIISNKFYSVNNDTSLPLYVCNWHASLNVCKNKPFKILQKVLFSSAHSDVISGVHMV